MIWIGIVKHHFGYHLIELPAMHHIKETGGTASFSSLDQRLIIKAIQIFGSQNPLSQCCYYSLLDHAGGTPHSLMPVYSLVHQIL